MDHFLSVQATIANGVAAASAMHSFVQPIAKAMSAFASLICIFFLVTGGISYITSAGKPDDLQNAKKVIRNALVGLAIVVAATAITQILINIYPASKQASSASLPSFGTITPGSESNGLIAVLIKVVAGFLNDIIQTIAGPFLKALSFFTTSTPLMANNPAVFDLWRMMVGISDALMILVIALLGFHIMGASAFGFDELELKHLLPRVGLAFLLSNVSIFVIDGIIELSNSMIHAINMTTGSISVWDTLTKVIRQASGQSVAALLVMIVFLAVSFILLVYYIGRLITLYIGTVLAPLISLLWLIPGFRTFSETAAKTYAMTVFVLFVHVVILRLAASLLLGMTASNLPDTLMATITGVATLITLLKTQGVMMQLSYVSMGSRNARKLSTQFVSGVSYLADKYNDHRYLRPKAIRRMLPTNDGMQLVHADASGNTRSSQVSTATSAQVNNTGLKIDRPHPSDTLASKERESQPNRKSHDTEKKV